MAGSRIAGCLLFILFIRTKPTVLLAVTVNRAGVYLPDVPIGKRNEVAPGLKNFLRPTLLNTPSDVIIFVALKGAP